MGGDKLEGGHYAPEEIFVKKQFLRIDFVSYFHFFLFLLSSVSLTDAILRFLTLFKSERPVSTIFPAYRACPTGPMNFIERIENMGYPPFNDMPINWQLFQQRV